MSALRAAERTKRTIKWCPVCFPGNPLNILIIDINILDELHENLGISSGH